MPADNNPSRRRFRFSLRTLFVVVSVLGIASGGWSAYHLHWIRQREQFLARQQKLQESVGPISTHSSAVDLWNRHAGRGTQPEKDQQSSYGDNFVRPKKLPQKKRQPPGLLRLFGEEAVQELLVMIPREDVAICQERHGNLVIPVWRISATQPDYQRAVKLFPEANIVPMHWDDDYPPPVAYATQPYRPSWNSSEPLFPFPSRSMHVISIKGEPIITLLPQ